MPDDVLSSIVSSSWMLRHREIQRAGAPHSMITDV
jgi:hypothetical protein